MAKKVVITFIRDHEIQDEHRGTPDATVYKRGQELRCSPETRRHFVESMQVAVDGPAGEVPQLRPTPPADPGQEAREHPFEVAPGLFELSDGRRLLLDAAEAAAMQAEIDAAAAAGPQSPPGGPQTPPAGEWPKDIGGGWFQLSNGNKVQGKEAADTAQAALDAAGAGGGE